MPADRTIVLENVPPNDNTHKTALAPYTAASHGLLKARNRRIRIGFFGQLSPTKGIQVLLEAAREIAARQIVNLFIDIYGDYANQPPEFQKSVIETLANVGPNVRYHGPYDNSKVHSLMSSVDAVVVPSIWWENAPVVIEEALLNERPVICSAIGGMAEAVRHGVDGLQFPVGDSISLADTLAAISDRPEILSELRNTMRKPRTVRAVVADHLDLYQRLLGSGPDQQTVREDSSKV